MMKLHTRFMFCRRASSKRKSVNTCYKVFGFDANECQTQVYIDSVEASYLLCQLLGKLWNIQTITM